MQDEYGRPLFGMGTRSPCVFRRRTEHGGFVEVRATPWAMPGLLHRSEKVEIHEVENQTFRRGLACADRVVKSNALVGRHFEGAIAAGRRSASPRSGSKKRRGRLAHVGRDCRLGEPGRRKPCSWPGAAIEMSNCSGKIRGSRNCILFGNKARKGRVS